MHWNLDPYLRCYKEVKDNSNVVDDETLKEQLTSCPYLLRRAQIQTDAGLVHWRLEYEIQRHLSRFVSLSFLFAIACESNAVDACPSSLRFHSVRPLQTFTSKNICNRKRLDHMLSS